MHIPDITKDIKLFSVIDDEAFRRCSSKYAFDECIPLYPFILSKDKLSLLENKIRPALNYYFRFDMSRSFLKDFYVENANIKVTKNSTYKDFDRAFYKGIGDMDFTRLVYNLCQISPILEKSFNKDAMFYEVNNCNSSNMGRKVVANTLSYTNFNVAKWFFDNNIPFPFRNHKLSDEKLDRLKMLKRNLLLLNDRKNEFNKVLLNEYPKAFYSIICEGHNGLGVPYYGTISSPLRKYIDSLGERVVCKFMLDSYTDEDLEFYSNLVDKTCKNINSRAHLNKMYEKAYVNKLTARRK